MGIKTTTVRNTKGVLYLRGIPGAVKTKFKDTASSRGLDMTEAVTAMMRLYNKNKEFRKLVKKEAKRDS